MAHLPFQSYSLRENDPHVTGIGRQPAGASPASVSDHRGGSNRRAHAAPLARNWVAKLAGRFSSQRAKPWQPDTIPVTQKTRLKSRVLE